MVCKEGGFMIEMKNINLSFKNHILFKNQNISIPSSQITVITGESGSGKSTLLFELAGLTHYSRMSFIPTVMIMVLYFRIVDYLMI